MVLQDEPLGDYHHNHHGLDKHELHANLYGQYNNFDDFQKSKNIIYSESQKITQPTKIFDNEKYREVEKLMEEIEKIPSVEEIQRDEITFLTPDGEYNPVCR